MPSWLENELDRDLMLVQHGAKRCNPMSGPTRQKRFTVSLDHADYDALRTIADSHKPPLKLQYVIGVAVSQLLDRHAAKQLTFPLDR